MKILLRMVLSRILIILVQSLLCATAGAILGLIVPGTMQLMADMVGVDASAWQLGLMLGFATGTFKDQVVRLND